jgi:hypothetical protein
MIFCHQRFSNHFNFFLEYPQLFEEVGKNKRDGHSFYSLLQSSETIFEPIGTEQDYCLKVNGQIAGYFHKDYRNYFIYNFEPDLLRTIMQPQQPEHVEGVEEELPPAYNEEQPSNPQNNLLQYLKCPITHEIMRQPVIMQDGYTYEKQAITNWISRNNRSPMTNLPISNFQMIPNLIVSQLVRELV